MKYRSKPKDPYDLYLMLRYHGLGPAGIADQVHGFRPSIEVDLALQTLQERFGSAGHVGPEAVSLFATKGDDPGLRQDACQTIRRLLTRCAALEEKSPALG